MAKFKIKEIPELANGYYLLLDKVSHSFSDGEHTMSVDAKIINKEGQWNS
jgi:hypothetical protein